MKRLVSVAETSAWVLEIDIVNTAVPPALMLLREKVFETMGLDAETESTSVAVQAPAAQDGDKLVFVTLTGGDMTAVLVTCVWD